MKLRPGMLVTLRNVPGVWRVVAYRGDEWWEISPETSTPGLVALSACATMDARYRDLAPLLDSPDQEPLL